VNYDSSTSWPLYEKIEIKNCSFWKPGDKWAFIQTMVDGKQMIQNLVMQNLYFVKPIANPSATFSGIRNLTIKELYIGGQRIRKRDSSGLTDRLSYVTNFTCDFATSDN
jgi:hypothetical protein